MKKLILIGIGLAGAAAFIGFDAVEAFGNVVDRHNGVIFEADLAERLDALFFQT